MHIRSLMFFVIAAIVNVSAIAEATIDASETKPTLIEPEKQQPVETSSNTGTKVLGTVAGTAIGVVAAPAVILLSPLALLPAALLGSQASGEMTNAETVALPEIDQIAAVKFIGRKVPEDWKLNADLASCPFYGMAVPFTGVDDLKGEIRGRAILLNQRECLDGREERVLLAAERTERMIFFNKGTMQAGYKLEFTPLSKENKPEWLGQVISRLALAAQSDEKARKFYERLTAPIESNDQPKINLDAGALKTVTPNIASKTLPQ